MLMIGKTKLKDPKDRLPYTSQLIVSKCTIMVLKTTQPVLFECISIMLNNSFPMNIVISE